MILRRVLTMKSKVGRGKYPNETIERLIACDLSDWIRYIYYHYEEIDFIPEVKSAAGIVEEIAKPGVDHEAFWRNEHAEWARQREELGDEAYMRLVRQIKKTRRINKGETARSEIFERSMSKGALQTVNHGHGYIKGGNN